MHFIQIEIPVMKNLTKSFDIGIYKSWKNLLPIHINRHISVPSYISRDPKIHAHSNIWWLRDFSLDAPIISTLNFKTWDILKFCLLDYLFIKSTGIHRKGGLVMKNSFFKKLFCKKNTRGTNLKFTI